MVIVEKCSFPREKTCGDALTPRAVTQLEAMGLSGALGQFHRCVGLRLVAHDRAIEIPWPSHPVHPSHSYVVRRSTLDSLVAAGAVGEGAALLHRHEATAPLLDRGFVRGAVVQADGHDDPLELRARYVLVADGANSRFGRELGTFRAREWPYGTAIRAYWETPRSDETRIESVLDLVDRNGTSVPGYGWVFPVGDGTVNVGVGLLSTFRDWKSVNTTHLLDAFARSIADRWQIDPDRPIERAVSGRVPMGGSVDPKAGPTYLVAGDAAGSVNPFNGDGIDYALETGRMAAEVLHEALTTNDPSVLQRYPAMLDAEYGQYFAVARLFTRIIGRPIAMRELSRVAMHSRPLTEWMVRIMANLMRPDERGPAEMAYRTAAAIARLAPRD